MKYCYECGRITPGEPLFCNFCGRSYDVKLCPSKHPNPRIAEVCSQCGSRDLSNPGPQIPLSSRALMWLAKALFGLLVVCFSLFGLLTWLSSPEGQTGVFILALLLAGFWWIWSQLPNWLRRLVKKSFERKRKSHDR
ncbi:MAG TPA: hypothetical protein VFR24_25355 [Candidatus Angelobacter sp.]|nr:hypothetical protein [Candidatus Angelobacter sp.]